MQFTTSVNSIDTSFPTVIAAITFFTASFLLSYACHITIMISWPHKLLYVILWIHVIHSRRSWTQQDTRSPQFPCQCQTISFTCRTLMIPNSERGAGNGRFSRRSKILSRRVHHLHQFTRQFYSASNILSGHVPIKAVQKQRRSWFLAACENCEQIMLETQPSGYTKVTVHWW